MPLTRRVPPAPVAAIHRAEVDQAAETLARSTRAYLRRLLWELEYPRTAWQRGTGTGARALAGRPVLLAVQTDNDPPVRTRHEYLDGLLQSTAAGSALPPPPRPPAAVAPASPPMAQLDEDRLRVYVEAWGRYLAALVGALVDQELRAHWDGVTRFYTGTVTAVNVPQRVALVVLDADAAGQARLVAGFGARAWTARQLARRHVRVGIDGTLGAWVDDWS
jgi:hypothetical protein